MRKKDALETFKTVSTKRAMGLRLVRSAAEKLSPDAYDVLTGAMMGELEQWAQGHPGRTPSDTEITTMALGLLANREALYATPGPRTTFTRPNFEVPEYWLKGTPEGETQNRKALIAASLGREPTPAELAIEYHRSN